MVPPPCGTTSVYRIPRPATLLTPFSGDPSPTTAYGIYVGLKSAVRHRLGKNDLALINIIGKGNKSFPEIAAELSGKFEPDQVEQALRSLMARRCQPSPPPANIRHRSFC